jgi:hypothetical protein
MAAIPDSPAGPAQTLPAQTLPVTLPQSLRQALDPLLERAPAGLFPRARRLYFDKYPLEGLPDELDLAPAASPFRTFVLSEEPAELDSDPPSPHRLLELALVRWRVQEQPPRQAVLDYLEQRWQLPASELDVQAMEESWFREGGAWLRVTLPGADPAPAAVDPASTP